MRLDARPQMPYVQPRALGTLPCNASTRRGRIIHEAQARKMDDSILHSALYALAFVGADSTAMVEQQQWYAGKPEENIGLALASDTEAYAGHLGKARELTKRAVDSAVRADSKGNWGNLAGNALCAKRAFGNPTEAQQAAAEALKSGPTQSGRRGRSRACVCHGGRYGRADSALATRLGETLPAGHQMQSSLAARDSGAIGAEPGKDPSAALNDLTAARPSSWEHSVRRQSLLPLPCVCSR